MTPMTDRLPRHLSAREQKTRATSAIPERDPGRDTAAGARANRPPARLVLDREDPLGWLLPAWLALFLNRAQPYARQQEDGSYRWVHAPCDVRVLARHLRGEETIALAALDEAGRCCWACLDTDGTDGLVQLHRVRDALAARGVMALLEASRRGGHLWLLFDQPTPAARARSFLRGLLRELVAAGRFSTAGLEIYPDTDRPDALGHAVRLPLGVHRRTGRRYPMLDRDGTPLVFPDRVAALAYLLAYPRILPAQLDAAFTSLADLPIGEVPRRFPLPPLQSAPPLPVAPSRAPTSAASRVSPESTVSSVSSVARTSNEAERVPRLTEQLLPTTASPRSGTWSPMIRWVDAHVSPLDLLEELCPRSEMRQAGHGFLGWCPFHDDRAPSEVDGTPGTPSFYVVENARYGWSWRCLSSPCPFSQGPMKHSFRLFQILLGFDGEAGAAIRAAYARWPELEGGSSPRMRRRRGHAGGDVRGNRLEQGRLRPGQGRKPR